MQGVDRELGVMPTIHLQVVMPCRGGIRTGSPQSIMKANLLEIDKRLVENPGLVGTWRMAALCCRLKGFGGPSAFLTRRLPKTAHSSPSFTLTSSAG